MGKNAPKPDARIGDAALKSAETGERYLRWMQQMGDETMGWARDDRDRYQRMFQPIEDRMAADALTYDTPERRAQAAAEAVADVRQQSALAQAARERNLASMGVNPNSGRFAAEDRRAASGEALASAGASNIARKQVEATADAKRANAVNIGRGNAASALSGAGQSANMVGSGFQGAMAGYGQMGNLLNTQYQQQMQTWQANNQMWGGVGGGIGTLIGAFVSSKDKKTDKARPSVSVLDAVRDMPVEEWQYKDGEGDGGGQRHIGPYAEDFAQATGLGDGQTISVIDAVGVTMGAVQELADKVDDLSAKMTQGPSGTRRRQPVSVGV